MASRRLLPIVEGWKGLLQAVSVIFKANGIDICEIHNHKPGFYLYLSLRTTVSTFKAAVPGFHSIEYGRAFVGALA